MSTEIARPFSAARTDRRKFLAASGALALAGCATERLGSYELMQVPAPSWRVGDRWTYRRTDFYTKLDAGSVTREVVAVGPAGVRLVTRTVDGRTLDDATYAAPGVEVSGNLSEDSPDVAGTLRPPFERYAFPLASGKRWRQRMTRTDAGGFRDSLSASTRVEGWETVAAGGREVRAILIRREFNLGPKDSFTGSLYRYETEWYAPELGGPARLEIEEWFREKSHDFFFHSLTPGARYLYELVSFAAG